MPEIPVASGSQTRKPFVPASTSWYTVTLKAHRPPHHVVEEKPGAMRILIVDDDRPSLKMTAFLLREEGYTVFTADNGQDALRMIDEKTPDLLVLDVMMPGMDGWEVTRTLRRTTNLPILILSAKGETSDRVYGLDLGADDYLAKPFEPSELLARVRAVLRRAEAFTFGEPQSQLSVEGLPGPCQQYRHHAQCPHGRADAYRVSIAPRAGAKQRPRPDARTAS